MDMNSFSKEEKELLPDFRKKINNAEDSRDVINTFNITMQNLLKGAYTDKLDSYDNHIELTEKEDDFFTISSTITESDIYSQSDLKNIIERFAHSAGDRIIHLKKNNLKTKLKIKH